MALSQDEKNDIKAMVLIEIEKMFTRITDKYNTQQNHDMMLFLLDIEKAIKEPLMREDS
ncbi:MAG TPA: hypothetical protein VK892_13675 [Pyrinomonadaceae bacterium]|nr:hypothetical protein [Pyrinomonadaceae bacterium]